MKKVKGVKRYAKQFVGAFDAGEVPSALEKLRAVVALMERDRNFKSLLISPAFSGEEKGNALSFVSRKLSLPEKASRFLLYLVEEQAIIALPEITVAVEALYREMRKRARVVVTSPVRMDKGYEERLAGSLKQIVGKDVELEYVIDPSLLGGIRIRVGSTMYDSSIKGQLGLLRDKLIKG
ncbi:MAG: ATP synthase F1 subunit delta [Nitrospirales bacterium]|nr:ATP synthase F1 subunit delta [Nitrospirales bacterium]